MARQPDDVGRIQSDDQLIEGCAGDPSALERALVAAEQARRARERGGPMSAPTVLRDLNRVTADLDRLRAAVATQAGRRLTMRVQLRDAEVT